MITIKATSLNGHPLAKPLFAEFDTSGGSIGRRDDNTLILPDPQQIISRVQAVVEFRSGTFVIRDQGKSPIMINRKPLGNGHEAEITAGDEIYICGYLLMVSETASSTSPGNLAEENENPFADFLTPIPQSSNLQPQALNAQPQNFQIENDDPFSRIFSDNAAPAQSVKPNPVVTQPKRPPDDVASNSGASEIPEDFDLFADLMPASAPSGNLQLPGDIDLGLGLSDGIEPNESIDELFNLGSSPVSDINFLSESLSGSLGVPSPDVGLDPLAAFGVPPTRRSNFKDTQRNDTPELHGSMRLPEAKVAQVVAAKSDAQTPEALELFGAASTDNVDPLVPNPAILIMQSPITGDSNSSDSSRNVSSIKIKERRVATPKAAEKPQQKTQTAASLPPAQRDELLQALLDGAGMSDLALPGGLTPELMNLIGQLLRESTQGTLDLLLARALMKREMRGDVTIIVMQDNNPLKFSPTVEVALSHLLAPQGRGFLTPLSAIKGAYNDLRSHQLGFMAGMQAALSGVLARFHPERLERRLQRKSMLSSFLSMNRRAKLWDLYTKFYTDISRDAEDDFHALFGKEFLRAYEQQIAKLEKEQKEPLR